jgi:hypothetical protein
MNEGIELKESSVSTHAVIFIVVTVPNSYAILFLNSLFASSSKWKQLYKISDKDNSIINIL